MNLNRSVRFQCRKDGDYEESYFGYEDRDDAGFR